MVSTKIFPFCLIFLAVLSVIGMLIMVQTIGKLDVEDDTLPASGCRSCKQFNVLGSREYLAFKEEIGDNGCSQMTISCGKEKGTEVIIQWYKDHTDLGVSFLDRKGQSNIVRVVQCNSNGEYELEENGVKEVINGLECIVAHVKEEL